MKSSFRLILSLGLTFMTIVLGSVFEMDQKVNYMTGIVVLMASLWVTEAINIYVTALLPLILFPIFGIAGMKEISPKYMSHIIFLFIGGFLLAFAIERWNLHKRLALNIIVSLGGSPQRILFRFMLSSYLLSMWILNTATTMMLLPAALAIIAQVIQGDDKKFQTGLLLGIAFASSIGGSSTLVGTLPNLILSNFVKSVDTIPQDINFANWMAAALPISMVFFAITFYVLKKRFVDAAKVKHADMSQCRSLLEKLGPMGIQEKTVAIIFGSTIILWFFRKDLILGDSVLPGWVNLLGLPNPNFIQDGTIAIAAAVLLFIIPSGNGNQKGLLLWEDFKKLPIGIIFLFGSGFALSHGITSSGLSEVIQTKMSMLHHIPPILIMLALVSLMIFITEFTSNSASATLLIPLVYESVKTLEESSMFFLFPLTIAASFAFMLPVATPPNTLVFGTEKIAIKDMVRTGIWLNLAGIVVIFSICSWLVDQIFPA
jgi:solute carrier family 13 (sodium-dependent dicarboxylate transporter), member 2/3/5